MLFGKVVLSFAVFLCLYRQRFYNPCGEELWHVIEIWESTHLPVPSQTTQFVVGLWDSGCWEWNKGQAWKDGCKNSNSKNSLEKNKWSNFFSFYFFFMLVASICSVYDCSIDKKLMMSVFYHYFMTFSDNPSVKSTTLSLPDVHCLLSADFSYLSHSAGCLSNTWGKKKQQKPNYNIISTLIIWSSLTYIIFIHWEYFLKASVRSCIEYPL